MSKTILFGHGPVLLVGFIVLTVLDGIGGAGLSVLAGMAAQAAGIPFAIAAVIEDSR